MSLPTSSTRCLKASKNSNAFPGSPPRLMTSRGKCSSASAYAASGTKNDTSSQYVSITSRTRFPRTARMRILASTTRALLGIPLLIAGSLTDPLIFLHQLVFTGPPGRDHFVQVFRGGAHRLEFGRPASLLCGDVVAKRLSAPHDRQRSARFQIVREFLAEFAHANSNCLHVVYSLYTF